MSLMLATVTALKTTIYDVKTKAKIHEFKHDRGVNSVAFSNDGSMLATGDAANKTTIYDVKTKAKIHEFKHISRSIPMKLDL